MKCLICKNYYSSATHHLRLTILNSATQHINSTINLFYCFCHATSSIRTTKEATINSQWHKNADRIDHTHSRPRSRPAGTDSGSCKRRCTVAWTCSRQQSPVDCHPHLGCRRLQSDFQHTSADLQHAQTYTHTQQTFKVIFHTHLQLLQFSTLTLLLAAQRGRISSLKRFYPQRSQMVLFWRTDGETGLIWNAPKKSTGTTKSQSRRDSTWCIIFRPFYIFNLQQDVLLFVINRVDINHDF